MEVDKFWAVEWTIENFSCWNEEIHGGLISSPFYSPSDKRFFLISKSIKDDEEHLVVFLEKDQPVRFVGELSLIGSDGSLLCTQQVDSSEETSCSELGVPELPPEFKEVVALIKMEEALKGDRLTLRLRKKSSSDSVVYKRTTIRAFDAFFKITPDVLNDLKSSSTEISWFHYPLSEHGLKLGAEMGRMDLLASKDELVHANIELALRTTTKNKVWVLTRMTVLNNEDVVREEENQYLFRKDEKWTFSDSLTREEMAKKEVSLMLHFKIVPNLSCVHSVDLGSCCNEAFCTIPSIEFRHLTRTAPKEEVSKILTDVSNQPDDSLKMLSKELMCLYQDQEFSDFRLKCGDVSFPVHRNILSARSPVFKTMLSTDMTETVSGCMDIEDMEPSTLGLFLTYLYTGAVEDHLQSDSALKLYYAADKYQVPTLKMKCANFLCANVSISNVGDILS